MLPIKQQRRIQLGRIGLVNLDSGADDVFNSIKNVATTVANETAPFAAAYAQEKGVNVAKSVKRENLVTFDENGQPKAFNVPQEFGLIARDAYLKVVNRRFEETIIEEIETKSIELANKYPSPVKYNNMMGDYLKNMDSASQGRFNEYISNVGSKVMQDTSTKLEIAAQKRRIAEAKRAAKLNNYNAQRKLRISSALTNSPQGFKKLNELYNQATTTAAESFSIFGDPASYQKDLDDNNFAYAGAIVNMIGNSTKNFSESDRAAIEAAIANPAFISLVSDPSTRFAVSQIHSITGGLGIDQLSSAYGNKMDALAAFNKAVDDEYLTNKQDDIDAFTSTTFNSVGAAIAESQNFLSDAPESSEGEVNLLRLGVIGNTVNSQLNNVFQGAESTDIETAQNNMNAALALPSASNNPRFNALSPELQEVVRPLFDLSEEDRKAILSKAEMFLNPTKAAFKLSEDAIQDELDKENLELTTAATESFIAASAKIELALNSDDPKAIQSALDIFSDIEGANLLTGNERKKYLEYRAVLQGKINSAKGKIETKKYTDDEAKLINETIRIMRNETSISAIEVRHSSLSRWLTTLIGDHSPATIAAWTKDIDSIRANAISKDQDKANISFARQSEQLVRQFEGIPESGEPITEAQLKAKKKEVRQLYTQATDYKEPTLTAYESRLDVAFAISQMQQARLAIVQGTDRKGVSPLNLKNIIDVAQSKDQALKQSTLAAIPEGTALRTIAETLYAAVEKESAKSEIRTQINQLVDTNNKMWSDYTAKIEKNQLLDEVNISLNFSSEEAIKARETEVAGLAGFAEGQPIDWNTPDLINKEGSLTQFGQEMLEDLSKGIVYPSFINYLQAGAELGTFASDNAFQLFSIASNSALFGESLNVWNMEGTNQLSDKAKARLGGAMLAWKSGIAESPRSALSQIVSAAQAVGGSIPKHIEGRLDIDLKSWIGKTYPEADARTQRSLFEATLVVGIEATSESDLKNRLNSWIDTTHGTDPMVIGNQVAADKVSGARSKYLNSGEIRAMDNAIAELVFESVDDSEQARLFEEVGLVQRANQVAKFFTRNQFYPSYALQNAQKGYSKDTVSIDTGAGVVEVGTGKVMRMKADIKIKEAPTAAGIYFVYAKTNLGTYQQITRNGIPLSVDAFEFKEKSNAHSKLGMYNTFYRSAIQNDPNGARYSNPNWLKTFGQQLGLIDEEVVAGPSQATIDAERALLFARFPERIEDNRAEFDRLVESGAILSDDLAEFLELGGINE